MKLRVDIISQMSLVTPLEAMPRLLLVTCMIAMIDGLPQTIATHILRVREPEVHLAGRLVGARNSSDLRGMRYVIFEMSLPHRVM